MLALDKFPEGLELFLTNSFGNLTTESSSVIQNETGSVKVRRNSYSYNMIMNSDIIRVMSNLHVTTFLV
jgi:hypothetical protein